MSRNDLMGLGKPIDNGWTSEIYPFGDGQILKLYFKSIREEFIEYEFNATKFAYESGLPVPKVICNIEKFDDRLGFCMEYIEGINMREIILQNPDKSPDYYQRAGELHARIHACSGEGLDCYRGVLTKKIKKNKFLPWKHRWEGLNKFKELPIGDRLCHGDFTTGNILVTEDDRLFVIDWSHAGCGFPIADIVRTLILNQLSGSNDPSYLETYLSLSSYTLKDIKPWVSPIAISLMYDIPSHRKELKIIAKEGIS